MFDLTIVQGLASQAVAWLLTYALHSTLFLGLAWLASRRLARRMPAVEETVWRFALIAGLITASLQISIGREPLTGSWRLASSPSPAVSAPAPSVSITLGAPASSRPRAARVAALLASPEPASPAPSPSLPLALTGIWLAGALLLAASWLVGYLRLRRRLRPRPQVIEAPMVALLEELQDRAGLRQPVRLTCSSRLPVPVALGVRRPEVCVPPRALAGLAPEQQEGMLAHELAHLVRRDPFWLAFGRLLASVLFFQPLNWVAVRRLRALSELLCDEWAVGRTGRPVSLARCLAEVAGWSFQPLGALPAPGMADRPSHLAYRIRRLLEEARSPQRRIHPVWLTAGMLVLVLTVATAAPGVQAAVARGKVDAPAPVPAPAEPLDPTPKAAPTPHPSPEPALAAAKAAGDEEGVELDDEVVPADLADQIEDELERSLDSVTGDSFQIAMDGLDAADADMAAAMAEAGLSEQETREIEQRYEELSERISKQVEERLEPKIEELQKQMSQIHDSEAMRDLHRRIADIAERARPSEEEMAKLHAEIEKLRSEGGLSEEDRQKIREDARRMAQEHRLTAKDRAEIDQLRRQAHEMAQRSLYEHRAEIDQMRQQIQEEARAIREEIRRRLDNDPQLRELRERRHQERERQRERMRQDRERAPRPEQPEPPEQPAPPAPPERQVRLHIAPEVRVRVEPAVAPVAPVAAPRVAVDVQVRPAVAPVAAPTLAPSTPAEAPEAPPAR